MSVEFRPSTQEFIVSSDTEWTVAGWDMDSGAILYRGPRTKADTFMGSLTKFSPMPDFPRMWLDNWEKRNITPNFPGVLLNYIGFRNGNVPLQRRLNGSSAQSVSTSAESTGGNTEGLTISGTFNYVSSRTTWTWFETGNPPNNPRFNSIDGGVNPLLRLTGWDVPPVSNQDGDSIPVSLANLIQLFNTLSPVIIVVDYEREELIPNSFWACRSVVEWRLQ